MHQLEFDLPERTGFGGLWSAMDDDHQAPAEQAPVARHHLATSEGASSPEVLRALQAFRSATSGDGIGGAA